MSMKRIYGMFAKREDAAAAFEGLTEIGYGPNEVSVISREMDVVEALGGEGGGTKAGETAASGAATGGLVGGLAGLLVGIGAIAIPGIGALFIAGPLAAALGLSGAAAVAASGALTGALAGGLVGALVGLGIPEEKAEVYEARIREGGILLAVDAEDDKAEEVMDIFGEEGANDIVSV